MLTVHLLQAIKLNARRLWPYARLTRGRSLPVSLSLIGLEALALPGALVLDSLAFAYVRQGVPIIQDDFVEVELEGEFCSWYPPPTGYSPADGRAMALSLSRQRSFASVSAACEQHLVLLSDPACHCMLRHLLESMRRIAGNAPHHARLSRKSSPEWLSWALLRLHRELLPVAAALDHQAAGLQARGVPILFQDLPRIAPLADRYARK